MNLTNHQSIIMEQILDELDKGTKRIILKGSAGVGKTWLMRELIYSFKKRKYQYGSIYTTAPTHKALSVLKDKVGIEKEFKQYNKNPEENIGKYVVFNTVHAALKLKMKTDRKTGIRTFVQEENKKYPSFDKCILAIVDESSMLDKPVILKNLERYDFPIIFVGDDKQLNPVGYESSPVFCEDFVTFELTEIIRQGEGNPIIDLSRNLGKIRSGIDRITSEDTGYLYDNNRATIIERLAEVNGTDELKYLAYTNAEVSQINKDVRERIYGKPAIIEQGETIVLNAPFKDLYTNQEVKVETIEIVNKDFFVDEMGKIKINLKVYMVNNYLPVIHEDSKEAFKRMESAIKVQIKAFQLDWTDYYRFTEQFVDFTYNHAITIHKSQGSTYKTAIVNVANIFLNRVLSERDRLLYTAVTRASHKLILYKAKA